MELWADALFWKLPDMRIPGDYVVQAARVIVKLLTQRLQPDITSAVLGDIQVPVPPVELHIAGGTEISSCGDETDAPLDKLIVLDIFGARRGTAGFYRVGEYLSADLAAEGKWHEAVTDALLIAMDWGFLNPRIG